VISLHTALLKDGCRWTKAILAVALAYGAALTSHAHPAEQGSASVAFEAASVKPNRSGLPNINVSTTGDRLSAVNAPAQLIVRLAYAIPDDRIVGAPEWLRSERFDIVVTSSGPMSLDKRNQILKSLLQQRFGLVARMETRELPIFALVTARADGTLGPNLIAASVDCAALTAAAQQGTPLPPSKRILCGSTRRPGGVSVGGMTMREVAASILSPQVGRPVVDRTGLAGSFDFDLDFAPAAPAAAETGTDAPSIFTAVQEQLGLKLEATRGPVEVLVIDSIQRPTAD
jgi:uncharacterized protein (TIGR03435 family)